MFLDKNYHQTRMLKLMKKHKLDIFETYYVYTNIMCESYVKHDKLLVEVAWIPMLLRFVARKKGLDILKNKLGSDKLGDGIEKAKEEAINWITDKLGLGDDMVKSIKDKISDLDIQDLPKLFSDKEYLTNLVFDNFVEAGGEKLKGEGGDDNFINSMLKNILGDASKDDEMADKIKSVMYNTINSKMGSVVDSIKSKIFGGA